MEATFDLGGQCLVESVKQWIKDSMGRCFTELMCPEAVAKDINSVKH